MNIKNKNRIVLKVGSSLISPNGEGCSSRYLLSIANFIVQCLLMGIDVILVSSGSVAAGKTLFNKNADGCGSVTLKKAMAAAGQMEMMAAWNRLFDFPTAQLLLTQHDLQQHERFLSIRESIENLVNNNILPIINENDAVTTDVSRVGDNDNLSAMVAAAVGADALIICSDVDGLYNKNPRSHDDAQLIDTVRNITPKLMQMAGDAGSAVGTGGMRTKLQAARKATTRGIPTVIMNGFKEAGFNALLCGNNPGTLFHAVETPLEKKKHWLMYGTRAQGELVVSDDAIPDDASQNFHLSYDDILDVNGEFVAGDTVVVKNQKGHRIAKAKTESGSCLLDFMINSEKDDTAAFAAKTNKTRILNNQEFSILEE